MEIETMAMKIDSLEDVMLELEYEPEKRDQVWKWLRNIRDDITTFLKDYGYET
jgi:hypothetical protein